ERLKAYEDIIKSEGENLAKLEDEKTAAQEEITEAEEAIQTLQDDLKELAQELEEKTKKVDEVKKTTNRAGKALDQALKEVAGHVSCFLVSVDAAGADDTTERRDREVGAGALRNLPEVQVGRNQAAAAYG
ncbi:hypothetical protein TRAPUB_3345, partial [Trametes pubescens]